MIYFFVLTGAWQGNGFVKKRYFQWLVAVLYLDFSKAFDRVTLRRLLLKLYLASEYNWNQSMSSGFGFGRQGNDSDFSRHLNTVIAILLLLYGMYILLGM